MQHDPSFPTDRLRQYATYILIMVGLALFVFGGGKAISQTDDERYVEGEKRQQQVQAAFLATTHGGATHQSSAFTAAATRTSVTPNQLPDPDPQLAPSPARHGKNGDALGHRVVPNIERAVENPERKNMKTKAGLLHPSGQQRAAD